MRIGNNISAMNTLNRLSFNNGAVAKSLEKLSSGSAINRAADDAAGLAISERMRAQIAGLERAEKNAQDGISLVQTAEGNLDQTHVALRRMYSLAMQAKNGTIDDSNREKIQAEIDARIAEIDRVADTANFNGIKLFDGSLDGHPAADAVNGEFTAAAGVTDAPTDLTANGKYTAKIEEVAIDPDDAAAGTKLVASLYLDGKAVTDTNGNALTADVTVDAADAKNNTFEIGGITFTGDAAVKGATIALGSTKGGKPAVTAGTGESLVLHIGATPETDDQIDVDIADMHAASLGLADLSVSNFEDASEAMHTIEDAIELVSNQRGSLGAVQNRLEQTIENLKTANENMSAAESRIRDADMAKEITTFTKFNILSQAAQAMLAQANAQPQGVLQLLG